MRGRRRREARTSDVILLAMGLFAAAFIAVMTVTFWVKGAVPDTLIQYTLGAGGVEALLLVAKAVGCWVTKDYRLKDVVIYDFPGGVTMVP